MHVHRIMPRYRRRLRVRYREETDDKELVALTHDVGPGGLAVYSNRPAAMGSHIALAVDADNGETIEVRGRVVWSRRNRRGSVAAEMCGFGVELTDADERWYQFVLDAFA